MVLHGNVHLNDALKTPQFWLIWAVLCLNVSAGIGVIGMASPMLQEIFGGSLIGKPELGFAALDGQKAAIAVIAAGFAGMLSLFNIAGRIVWASASDHLGRKATYFVFFALGIALYASVRPSPIWDRSRRSSRLVHHFVDVWRRLRHSARLSRGYFRHAICRRDHGRLLTAWSTAGIVGPVVVNYIREFNKAAGVPADRLYDVTMYVLAGFLVLGLICNALVRPVDAKWLIPEKEAQQFETAHAIPSGPIGAMASAAGRSTGKPSWPGLRWQFRWPGACSKPSPRRWSFSTEGRRPGNSGFRAVSFVAV